MTIRAHIAQKYWADTVEVFIVDHAEMGRVRVLYMDETQSYRWEEHDEAVSDVKPTLQLPRDSGRALLQALVEHYNGADDTRALRRDYEAERKRVDTQAATISDTLVALARRSFD